MKFHNEGGTGEKHHWGSNKNELHVGQVQIQAVLHYGQPLVRQATHNLSTRRISAIGGIESTYTKPFIVVVVRTLCALKFSLRLALDLLHYAVALLCCYYFQIALRRSILIGGRHVVICVSYPFVKFLRASAAVP